MVYREGGRQNEQAERERRVEPKSTKLSSDKTHFEKKHAHTGSREKVRGGLMAVL